MNNLLKCNQKLNLIPQITTRCHMQTAWIWMRRRATRRLIRIQAVWHTDNILTIF